VAIAKVLAYSCSGGPHQAVVRVLRGQSRAAQQNAALPRVQQDFIQIFPKSMPRQITNVAASYNLMRPRRATTPAADLIGFWRSFPSGNNRIPGSAGDRIFLSTSPPMFVTNGPGAMAFTRTCPKFSPASSPKNASPYQHACLGRHIAMRQRLRSPAGVLTSGRE